MGRTRSKTLWLIVLSLLSPAILFAQSRQEIGTVVTTQGIVAARDSAGTSRTLDRRSRIFEGDVIVVGPDGFASLRMIDNAHLSLGSATEFAFDAYRFDGKPGTRDRAVMRLVSGCFRTRVGGVGAAARDEYRIETPVASIAVEASFHGATLIRDRLYTATWDGATTVSNVAGSLSLGEYGDYEYSRTLPGMAPTGLLALLPEAACEAPEALDGKLDPPRKVRQSRDEDDESD